MQVGDNVLDSQSRIYTLVAACAAGGQGAVFKGVDTQSHEAVAVKIFHDTPNVSALQNRVHHAVSARFATASPYVVGPRTALQFQKGHVSNWAEGSSIESLGVTAPWSLYEGLIIATCLARGLADLARMGYSHGDIAATNAHVVVNGAHTFATWIDLDNYLALNGTGSPPAIGQEPALAPEIYDDQGLPTQFSDRWAFASLLHEVLLKRHAFLQHGSGLLTPEEYLALISRDVWPDDPRQGVRPAHGGVPVLALPETLHEGFRTTFVTDPVARWTPGEWIPLLVDALSNVLACHVCGAQFVNRVSLRACPWCHATPPDFVLELDGHRVPLLAGSEVTVVGRADLFADPHVSAEHAVFTRDGCLLRVQDRSKNGTQVFTEGAWKRLQYGETIVLAEGTHVIFAGEVRGRVRAT